MHMEIEIAKGRAFVARPDAYFLASVTLEWCLGVVEFELVFGVAEMGNLVVFHDCLDLEAYLL